MPKATKAKGAASSGGKSPAIRENEADILVPSTNDMIESGQVDAERVQVPKFAPHTSKDREEQKATKVEFRRVSVPQHRMTPLKNNWLALYTPVTENLKLDMRMNLKSRKVEIKTTDATPDAGNLQRAADFVHAFILGFEVNDAIALLRLDDLYIESFEVKDVKTLRGEHLARGIGRMAGKSGKTKFTIENSSRTRIVLADTKIHILGSFQNIRVARDAICNLIMGSPAGKVYNRLRSVSARLNASY
jgi:RNA-binding protein PNO1